MDATPNKISIIIVTYNSLPALKSCLLHIREAIKQLNCEVIIVDNNSNDHSPSAAKNILPNADIIVNRDNMGFASGCNFGARQASGNLLLFVNPDVYIDGNCIEELVSFMQDKARIGAVGARLRNPDGSFQASCRKLPTFSNILFSRGSLIGKIFGSTNTYTLPDSANSKEVPALAGTLFMIRRDVFETVNRFDARFFMFMEDTDLCKRLNMLGFTNYFVPSAGAVHEWGRGSSAGLNSRTLMHHKSVFKYFVKHRKGAMTYLVLPILLAVNFLLVAFINLFRRSRVD